MGAPAPPAALLQQPPAPLRPAPVGQPGEPERPVCRILYYAPQRRTPDLDLVEDAIPLHDVALAVRTGWTPRTAYLAPERIPLAVRMDGAYVHVQVPHVHGHAIVVLER